jgi:hypothetical protein
LRFFNLFYFFVFLDISVLFSLFEECYRAYRGNDYYRAARNAGFAAAHDYLNAVTVGCAFLRARRRYNFTERNQLTAVGTVGISGISVGSIGCHFGVSYLGGLMIAGSCSFLRVTANGTFVSFLVRALNGYPITVGVIALGRGGSSALGFCVTNSTVRVARISTATAVCLYIFKLGRLVRTSSFFRTLAS